MFPMISAILYSDLPIRLSRTIIPGNFKTYSTLRFSTCIFVLFTYFHVHPLNCLMKLDEFIGSSAKIGRCFEVDCLFKKLFMDCLSSDTGLSGTILNIFNHFQLFVFCLKYGF